ncbi:13832_t:CDS:1, partial [Funneliformis mosseae]
QIKHLYITIPIILNDNKTKTEELDIQNIIDDDWRISNSEEINIQDEDDFNEEKNNNEIVEPIEEHELQ